mgnify:CR=1 FL=1
MTTPRYFTHECKVCGRIGSFGVGASPRYGKEGEWYCFAHLPAEFTRHWANPKAPTSHPGGTTPAAQSEGAAGASPDQGLDDARLQGDGGQHAPIEAIRHSPAERKPAPRRAPPAGQDDLFSTMGKKP